MDYFKHSHKIERFELLENGKCYSNSANISLRNHLYFEQIPISFVSFFKSSIPYSEVLENLSNFQPVQPNALYGPSWSIIWFKLDLEIPLQWLEDPLIEVHLIWDSGSEALLFNYNCTEVLQGFTGDDGSNKRSEYIIRNLPIKNDLTDPKTSDLMSANKLTYLFGNGPLLGPKDPETKYSIKTCSIGRFNRKAWDLLQDFIIIKDAADLLDPIQQNRSAKAIKTGNTIMDIVNPKDPLSYSQAQILSKSYLSAKNSESQHQIYVMGHCHIDTAWLWTFDTTRKKTARSWSAQLELMKHYKDYKFSASQAQQYQWLKIDYPKLFQQIQAKAKEMRFIPVGGTWVEFDGNIPSGESMVRQFLYGQHFFKENFGKYCDVFFMPDTFGYSPQLPQIMKEAGISNFLTQKLSWSLVNKFPHTNFLWKGLDGSYVLAHFPPADTYNSQGNLGDVLKSQTNFKGNKGKSNCSVLLFGNGDGGGGPKMDYIESLQRMRDLEGVPKVSFTDLKDFYDELRKNSEQLETWDGELYLELHNGTYTTMAENKKYNRRLEMRLRDCELLISMALQRKKTEKLLKYYHGEFKALWKVLLLDQFHDVLPGTSIGEVYEDTHRHYEKIEIELNKKIRELLEELCLKEGKEKGIYYFNAINYEREFYFQNFEAFVKIPAFSHGFISENKLKDNKIEEKEVYLKEEHEFYELVNKNSIVKISKTGLILSIKDQRTLQYSNEKTMREVLMTNHSHYQAGNCLLLHNDVPFFWDAWDIFPYYKDNEHPILAYESRIIKETNKQIRILFKYKISDLSEILQTVDFLSNCSKLEFHNEIHWHETRKLLRVYFPVNIRTDFATFDVQNGILRRSTHNNTSWDAAKHEVYGHKFVDVSENSYGVSLLNNCKYGYSAKESVLGLSLLKSSKHPNEKADMGVHFFTYSLYWHEGACLAGTLKEAEILNEELMVVEGNGEEFKENIVKIDKTNVLLDCLKPSEIGEDVVLRVHEHLGEETCFCINLGWFCEEMEVKSVDILEEDKWANEKQIILGVEGGRLMVKIKPFQILSFRIIFKKKMENLL